MVILPQSNNLPVEYLAASFDKVTNSYKFYWFLAILEHIRESQSRKVPINNLLARMVASVWYPTNYFRLSFGKQDRLAQLAVRVGEYTGLSMDRTRQEVIRAIEVNLASDSSFARDIKSLGQYVPFRFLRPFFAQQLRGLDDWNVNESIDGLAAKTFNDQQSPCMYRLINQPSAGIEIQANWFEYLNRHLTILIGFCLWNLVIYVQKNNPNVPNIPNKLFEPGQRNLNQARAFWRQVFDKVDGLTCIYSGEVMKKGGFSLDHFLPWRFVAHDLLWNIIPTPRIVNSAKSDNLPNLDRYFAPFAQLQYDAIQTVVASTAAQLLEDHILLLGVSSITELQSISFQNFRNRLHATLLPQFQIATNMGFPGHWIYV